MTQPPLPPTSSLIPPSGIRRQLWMSSQARQNVIYVRDASGSMQGKKAAVSRQ